MHAQAVVDVWQLFEAEFLQLWTEQGHNGDAYPAPLFGDSVPQGQQALKVLTSHPHHAYTCTTCMHL